MLRSCIKLSPVNVLMRMAKKIIYINWIKECISAYGVISYFFSIKFAGSETVRNKYCQWNICICGLRNSQKPAIGCDFPGLVEPAIDCHWYIVITSRLIGIVAYDFLRQLSKQIHTLGVANYFFETVLGYGSPLVHSFVTKCAAILVAIWNIWHSTESALENPHCCQKDYRNHLRQNLSLVLSSSGQPIQRVPCRFRLVECSVKRSLK